MSNHHHQQSSNSSLNENSSASISPKSTSAELTSTSTLIKIPSASSSSSFFIANSTLSPLIPIGNLSKLSKHSLSVHSQDSPSISPRSRVETPHDYLETKFCFDQPVGSPIDPSRFCRFIFPDSTSAVIRVGNSSQTIRHAIHYLFAKRGITWYRTELFSFDQSIDIGEFLSSLAGKEIRVERRILIRWDFPTNLFCIRCDPKRTLQQILQPILDKLQTSMNKYFFYMNDCLIPLNLNEFSGAYDNQRLFAFSKTSSGNPDMSTRDRFKIINDIFDMIPENDEDIQFDQHGILKLTKLSTSNDDLPTMRISNAD